jgi:hypothetical protein
LDALETKDFSNSAATQKKVEQNLQVPSGNVSSDEVIRLRENQEKSLSQLGVDGLAKSWGQQTKAAAFPYNVVDMSEFAQGAAEGNREMGALYALIAASGMVLEDATAIREMMTQSSSNTSIQAIAGSKTFD